MIRLNRAVISLPLFFFITLCISCKNETISSPEQRYYYYPKTNTYFDATSSEYIYSLDSGRNWIKMKTNVTIAPPALGNQVSLKETGEDVWYENEMHRNMYGGILYNVITKDTALLFAKPKEVKKPVAKQEDTVTTNTKKKRNIFQKIFGKKKN